MKRLLLAAALIAAPASARDLGQRIHDLPMAAEAAYCGLAVADSATTISIINRGGVERNPLFGKHPSDGTMIAAAVGKCLGHAAITSVLQDHAGPRAVRVWEFISIGVQGGIVVSNLTVRF